MGQNRPLGWTTLEEAKKLVEAGLDPNTADMSYDWVECRVIDGNAAEDWLLMPSPVDDRQPYEQLPCWSLGALIEISVKIIDNDYYFISSAKDFAYSHLLNSIRELMQKYDNFTEATVCFLLGLLNEQ